jgi:hypothetical protein
MMEYFAGLRIDYRNTGAHLSVKPTFPSSLDNAYAETVTPSGRFAVSWHRDGDSISLEINAPDTECVRLVLPSGYALSDASTETIAASGKYKIVRNKEEKI